MLTLSLWHLCFWLTDWKLILACWGEEIICWRPLEGVKVNRSALMQRFICIWRYMEQAYLLSWVWAEGQWPDRWKGRQNQVLGDSSDQEDFHALPTSRKILPMLFNNISTNSFLIVEKPLLRSLWYCPKRGPRITASKTYFHFQTDKFQIVSYKPNSWLKCWFVSLMNTNEWWCVSVGQSYPYMSKCHW